MCPEGFQKYWKLNNLEGVGPCILDGPNPWSRDVLEGGMLPKNYPCGCLGLEKPQPIPVGQAKNRGKDSVGTREFRGRPKQKLKNLTPVYPFQNLKIIKKQPLIFPVDTAVTLPLNGKIEFTQGVTLTILKQVRVLKDDVETILQLNDQLVLEKGSSLQPEGSWEAKIGAHPGQSPSNIKVYAPAGITIHGIATGFQLQISEGILQVVLFPWGADIPNHNNKPPRKWKFNLGPEPTFLWQVKQVCQGVTTECKKLSDEEMDRIAEELRKERLREKQERAERKREKELLERDRVFNQKARETYDNCKKENRKIINQYDKDCRIRMNPICRLKYGRRTGTPLRNRLKYCHLDKMIKGVINNIKLDPPDLEPSPGGIE
jgi:hypothetical protein